MAKHAHISRYYADDKDVVDLVSQSSIKPHQLASFLRERGIIVPSHITKNDLINYFRFIPLAWPDFDALVTRLDRTDREEKKSSCKITAAAVDVTTVIDVLAKIQAERGPRLAEIHQQSVTAPNVIEVKVQYTETDPSKTRALQRRERNLTIRIEKCGESFMIRHDDNPKARQIVERLERELAAVAPQPPTREVIDVSGLNSAKRDDFFTRMAKGLAGYDVDDVQDLKVELPEMTPDSGIIADEDVTREEPPGSEFEGVVKKAILSGTGLLLSRDYQRYSAAGFSIGKMIWTIREAGNVSDVIELMAEFHGENGTEFRYDVVGKYERDDNGDLKKSRIPVRGTDKEKFLSLLEGSAYLTLNFIRSETQTENPSVEVA